MKQRELSYRIDAFFRWFRTRADNAESLSMLPPSSKHPSMVPERDGGMSGNLFLEQLHGVGRTPHRGAKPRLDLGERTSGNNFGAAGCCITSRNRVACPGEGPGPTGEVGARSSPSLGEAECRGTFSPNDC